MSIFILQVRDEDTPSFSVGPFKDNVAAEQWAIERGWPKHSWSLTFVVEPTDMAPHEFRYPKENEHE